MKKRFVSIFFRYLQTDWFALREPGLKTLPFVLKASSHGRMIVTATNVIAEQEGISVGMPLADARAFVPGLQVHDDMPGLVERLLRKLAEWCIRFTPVAAEDPPGGLLLDVTGCAYLWGGDEPYLKNIVNKLQERGYHVSAAIADTIGAAWALARFGNGFSVIEKDKHIDALMTMPPEALRLQTETVDLLHKLGLHQVSQFIQMPRVALRRRLGIDFLRQLDKALGHKEEELNPVIPIELYQERLPCLEPIVTAPVIQIALQQLLESLCYRLQQEQKGLRVAILKCYRIDGKVEQVDITTSRPSYHVKHLFKLFEIKLPAIDPGLGIELFVLEAPKVEDHFSRQEKMWTDAGGLDDERLTELIDKLAGRIGMTAINRYIPDEHYWPERSFRRASSLQEKIDIVWSSGRLRPLQVLPAPELVEVTAPIPDYPPILFRYKGKVHNIVKADGPERIEQEWWLQKGQHRDYYQVEDEEGHRYWLFRLGHYGEKNCKWFIHGFFA